MKATDDSLMQPVAPQRLAEAGVWISRLHGGERDRELEAGFRRWLHAGPDNARAFELATEVWNDADNLRRVVPFASASLPSRRKPRVAAMAALAATITIAAAGTFFYLRAGTITTDIGEQRLLTLEDGSRVYLNTATRLSVKYTGKLRRIELEDGEALFDVAREPGRPFVVTAGDRRISALGTSFVVRRQDEQLAVTLVEGKVAVESRDAFAAADHSVILQPGQRLTLTMKDSKLETPPLELATAWRHGEVLLDDTPLSVAVAEMNRYSTEQLVLENSHSGAWLMNGLFQAGDSLSFANAVAQTYGLKVTRRPGQIVLSGSPALPVYLPPAE